jgi:D-glucosaminate-specific PTS system IIC component
MNNFIQALLIGVLYWLIRSSIGYTFGLRIAYTPMTAAVFVGLVMGNLKDAIIIGAYIQAVYVGIITNLGGVGAIDKALATCLAIPIALKSGMSPELAVTMAIPFGLLGSLGFTAHKLITTYFTHKADACAERGDAKGVRRFAFLWPPIAWFPLAVIPVTLIVYLGPELASGIIDAIPKAVISGLQVAGGLLPALGFAMTIRVIGRKNLLPFFFAGFFLIQYARLSTIGAAIFGTIIAIIYVQLKGAENNGRAS